MAPPPLLKAQASKRRLLTTIEADRRLSESIPLWVKLLFLATNLPYWIISIYALTKWTLDDASPRPWNDLHVDTCRRDSSYAALGLAVAASSTLMHAAQLRVSHYSCDACCRIDSKFDDDGFQWRVKRLDIGFALLGTCASLVCHPWQDLVICFALALPCFMLAAYAKRVEWHAVYLFAHGAWHIATSLPSLAALALIRLPTRG